jgi:copper chaperone CopZ
MGIKPTRFGGVMSGMRSTAVLEVSGVQWASSKNVAEAVLSRRPGVLGVEANPMAQTATVIYDPSRTSVAELAGWVRDCGYHCAGHQFGSTSAIHWRNHQQLPRTCMIILRPRIMHTPITAQVTPTTTPIRAPGMIT